MRTVTITLIVVTCWGCAADVEENVSSQTHTAASDVTLPPSEVLLPPTGPTEVDYPPLHNLLQVSDRIYTGGEPKGCDAFASLTKLGVHTVVSVDGARPNVKAAQENGLRYVHIPIGYDGISDPAGRSLARLVQEIDGPIYIHCHHGNHRGPAAAAVACIATGATDGEGAMAILKRAGTSENYAGLWKDVKAYRPPPVDVELPELVEIAEVESLTAAMSQIDRASDNLKLCEAIDWQSPPKHPDIVASQEALLLKEGFRESARQLREDNPYDARFMQWMTEAEQTAEQFETALDANDATLARELYSDLQTQCSQCHKNYRN